MPGQEQKYSVTKINVGRALDELEKILEKDCREYAKKLIDEELLPKLTKYMLERASTMSITLRSAIEPNKFENAVSVIIKLIDKE